MVHTLRPVDISANPELLRLAEEVRVSQEPLGLRRESEAVAILMPIRPAPKRQRRRWAPGAPAPATFTLETAAGSVPALAEPLTWEEIERRVKEDREERLLRKLGRA